MLTWMEQSDVAGTSGRVTPVLPSHLTHQRSDADPWGGPLDTTDPRYIEKEVWPSSHTLFWLLRARDPCTRDSRDPWHCPQPPSPAPSFTLLSPSLYTSSTPLSCPSRVHMHVLTLFPWQATCNKHALMHQTVSSYGTNLDVHWVQHRNHLSIC